MPFQLRIAPYRVVLFTLAAALFAVAVRS